MPILQNELTGFDAPREERIDNAIYKAPIIKFKPKNSMHIKYKNDL